jgi:mevalonate kinase
MLSQLGVSSPQLDALVEAARDSGALGAKLSGGGRGGAMIALVQEQNTARVAAALQEAGAAHLIQTKVGRSSKR